MKRCMTFSRVLRRGVHHTFNFLMSVFNQRVTDVLFVLLLYRQYKAPGGDCCGDLFLYKCI